jgi:hypothetical protein
MNKDKYTVLGLLLFFLVAAAGISITINSWHGSAEYAHVPTGESRDPAAIREVFNQTDTSGLRAIRVDKDELQGTKITKTHDSIGVELNHFLVQTPSGKKTFACVNYDKVALTFEAVGMAVSGEPSTMTVEGDCTPTKDYSQITPIWIPMSKVVSGKAKDMSLDYLGYNPIHLKFQNIDLDWPEQWTLTQVRFFMSSQPNSVVSFDLRGPQKKNNQMLTFSWPLDTEIKDTDTN